jgi:hypothetical protein
VSDELARALAGFVAGIMLGALFFALVGGC